MTKTASLRTFSLAAVPVLAAAAIFGIIATASASQDGVFENLTEEQKAAMEQVRELKEEGNHEEARAIAEEAGLPHKHGRHHQDREAVKEAIENNDYEAFLEVTKDHPFAEDITEEKFTVLVEIHELREAGDFEAARALAEEAGLKHPHGEMNGRQPYKNIDR